MRITVIVVLATQFLGLAIGIVRLDTPCFAQQPRVLRALPRSDEELSAAFTAAAAHACHAVAEGRSLETQSLSPVTVADVGLHSAVFGGNRDLPIPMARRPVLSVGLTLTPEDLAGLPFLSSSIIQSYLSEHYVCLQVLIRRDLDSGSLCLSDSAAAACLPFHGPLLTQNFEPLVRQSLQNTRCLGLYVAPGEDESAKIPGTLVFVVRNPTLNNSASPPKVEPIHELLFVRAKSVVSASGEEDLELHTFITEDRRSKLHYLPPFDPPKGANACNVTGSVVFTQYAGDGLTPIDSALRGLVVRGRKTLTQDVLNGLLTSRKDKIHWLDEPTAVLDAVMATTPATN